MMRHGGGGGGVAPPMYELAWGYPIAGHGFLFGPPMAFYWGPPWLFWRPPLAFFGVPHGFASFWGGRRILAWRGSPTARHPCGGRGASRSLRILARGGMSPAFCILSPGGGVRPTIAGVAPIAFHLCIARGGWVCVGVLSFCILALGGRLSELLCILAWGDPHHFAPIHSWGGGFSATFAWRGGSQAALHLVIGGGGGGTDTPDHLAHLHHRALGLFTSLHGGGGGGNRGRRFTSRMG